jgi:hypothetical protein
MSKSRKLIARIWLGADGRIHVVNAERAAVPNSGMHLIATRGSASYRNLSELLEGEPTE